MVAATTLTAFNDNAAITYLASLVPGFSEALKYVVMAGAVTGGGLTVIANSPNPAGQSVWRAKLFRYFRLRVFKATIAEPRFERIWLQSKKRLLQHVTQKPGNIWLRSQPVVYRVGRKKHVAVGAKRITVELSEGTRAGVGKGFVRQRQAVRGGSSGRCLLLDI